MLHEKKINKYFILEKYFITNELIKIIYFLQNSTELQYKKYDNHVPTLGIID